MSVRSAKNLSIERINERHRSIEPTTYAEANQWFIRLAELGVCREVHVSLSGSIAQLPSAGSVSI